MIGAKQAIDAFILAMPDSVFLAIVSILLAFGSCGFAWVIQDLINSLKR